MHPLEIVLSAKATFVAQTYPGKMKHMAEVLAKAVEHDGFSYIRVLQPCVTYNDTWKFYGKNTEIIDDNGADLERAKELIEQTDKFPLGIIYRSEEKPPFHKALYEDLNPIRDSFDREKRISTIKNLFG